MTHTLKLYGASDDLIEIEGAINDEFSSFRDDKEMLLAISDGTLLRILYSHRGVWRFELVSLGAESTYKNIPAPEDDEDNYSDVVTIESNRSLVWVTLGEKMSIRVPEERSK